MTIDASISARFHASMQEIDAAEWDALVSAESPHLSHRFLSLAESSGSVCEETGWLPCHLTLRRETRLIAAMPLYQKGHSWGEFVFDWSWADAYRRAGLDYYPKLVSATPFTPAAATKMLVADGEDRAALGRTLLTSVRELALSHGFSSIHLQFLGDNDVDIVAGQDDWLIRKDCQFHWHNQDYRDFDDFLAQFSSKKRKNVKRERRRIREAGIRHRIVAGAAISEAELIHAWQLCGLTFAVRGHAPYLNLEFFEALRREAPEQLVLVLAEHDTRIVAAAILLRGGQSLYGRYWGSDGDYHSLHFETCYYQGIDYCIREGIQRYEPGTQGEHKVSRGFLPVTTWSAHWLAHPQFAAAIRDYLEREAYGVERYMEHIDERSPFKALGSTDSP